MKKKLIVLTLAAITALSALTGCGSKTDEPAVETKPDTVVSEDVTKEDNSDSIVDVVEDIVKEKTYWTEGVTKIGGCSVKNLSSFDQMVDYLVEVEEYDINEVVTEINESFVIERQTTQDLYKYIHYFGRNEFENAFVLWNGVEKGDLQLGETITVTRKVTHTGTDCDIFECIVGDETWYFEYPIECLKSGKSIEEIIHVTRQE